MIDPMGRAETRRLGSLKTGKKLFQMSAIRQLLLADLDSAQNPEFEKGTVRMRRPSGLIGLIG
jgi:hypothetical protein